MRNLILTIACVSSLSMIVAQQNYLVSFDSNIVEFESNKKLDVKASVEGSNSNYLEERRTNQFSSIVEQWKYKIANYDLKGESVFDDSAKATYRIVFKNKQVDISVIYNNSGEVLNTSEVYKNISIPYELGALIAKEYPGWSFTKNSYCLSYSKGNGVEKQSYKLQITKDNQKKTLKFDKNFRSI